MEGASWIAKKASAETDRHLVKVRNLLAESAKRFKDGCILDESIAELNGREVIKLNGWLTEQLDREAQDVADKLAGIFENVNYHLAEANRHFAAQRANQLAFA